MANDVKLQSVEGKPVDENLRPILVGGKSTSLETAQSGNGVRVRGDLEVTGNLNGNPISRTPSGTINVTSGDDIKLTADEGITLEASSDIYIKSDDDIFLQSIDNITIDATDTLTIDTDGTFIMKKDNVEFSAANSAYAGMILGYTVIGLDETPASFDVTDAMLPVHDDLKVSFVFPPSGKVEIMSSIYIQTDTARSVTLGLSTTNASTGFTSLGAKYENSTYRADETDGEQHTHRWYVTGTAGVAEELWFAAGCTQSARMDLYWGGDSSGVADSSHPMEYQPFVMKAIALPETVYTG